MAKLFLRNAYEFENPSRRVSLAGELFEGSGAQVEKTKRWVNGKESSQEAIDLAELVAKQAEVIREGTKKELLELYINLFTTGPIASKEVFNAPPFDVKEIDMNKGLLQVLEEQPQSDELRIAFSQVPDLRLLAYATVYENFMKQGLDANYLPMGAHVSLVDGEVTMSYQEKDPRTGNTITKTATSELFPWSSYEIAHKKYVDLMRAEAEKAGEEAARNGIGGIDLDDDGTLDIPAVAPQAPVLPVAPVEAAPANTPTPEEPVAVLNETPEGALESEWLTQVRPTLEACASRFQGVSISFKDASYGKGEKSPNEVDKSASYREGKTVSIKYPDGHKERYQLLVSKGTSSWFAPGDFIRIAKDKGDSGRTKWETVARNPQEDLYEYFTGEMDVATKSNVLNTLLKGDIGDLNELPLTQQLYYLEWYVSRTLNLVQKNAPSLSEAEHHELNEFYKKGVALEVSEKWYLGLSSKRARVPNNQARLEQVKNNIRTLQGLRKAQTSAPTVEVTPLREAAGALHFADTTTPEQIRDGSVYLRNAQFAVEQLVSAYPSYLQIDTIAMQAPATDGSADWKVTLGTTDNQTIVVQATTPAVDSVKVDTFITEKAALGQTFPREDVISYAGYRAVIEPWYKAIADAKVKIESNLAKTQPAPTAAPKTNWKRDVEEALNE